VVGAGILGDIVKHGDEHEAQGAIKVDQFADLGVVEDRLGLSDVGSNGGGGGVLV
jgi:hypothetical protein